MSGIKEGEQVTQAFFAAQGRCPLDSALGFSGLSL